MVKRPKHPFDGERTPIKPGDNVLDSLGRVWIAASWYSTSYMMEAAEVMYRRGIWGVLMHTGRDDFKVIAPELTLRVKILDVPTNLAHRKSYFRSRWKKPGGASDYTRAQIAEHRAEVKRVGLPRDHK